ncbi:GATOR complex protein wdr59 [Phlyctochytrium bullatum]|nr:GATOR complex protein wdr59 [Phlyctochytrium bullatum]
MRKGSTPLTSITAHMTKVYGIDWNPKDEKEIITCSQDQTVKAVGYEKEGLPTPYLSDVSALPPPSHEAEAPESAIAPIRPLDQLKAKPGSSKTPTENGLFSSVMPLKDQSSTVQGKSVEDTGEEKARTMARNNLSADIAFIRKKFPAIAIERVDVNRRIVTVGFQRSFDVSGASPNDALNVRSAFIRVNIVFPLSSDSKNKGEASWPHVKYKQVSTTGSPDPSKSSAFPDDKNGADFPKGDFVRELEWFDDDDDEEENFSNNSALEIQSRLQSLKISDRSGHRRTDSSPDNMKLAPVASGSVPLSPAGLKPLDPKRERGASATPGDVSSPSLFETAMTSLGQSALSLNSSENWATPTGSVGSRRGTVFVPNAESLSSALSARRHRRSRSFHEVSRTNSIDGGQDNETDKSVELESPAVPASKPLIAERKGSRTSLSSSLRSGLERTDGKASVEPVEEDEKDTYNIKVCVMDTSLLLPVSNVLAEKYTLTGADPVTICLENSKVAAEFMRPDLAKIWTIAALLVEKQMDNAQLRSPRAAPFHGAPFDYGYRKTDGSRQERMQWVVEAYDEFDAQAPVDPQSPEGVLLDGDVGFLAFARRLIHMIPKYAELKELDEDTLRTYLFPHQVASITNAAMKAKHARTMTPGALDRDPPGSFNTDVGSNLSTYSWSDKLSSSVHHSEAVGIRKYNEHHARDYIAGSQAAALRHNSWGADPPHPYPGTSTGTFYSGFALTESPSSLDAYRSSMPKDRPLSRNLFAGRGVEGTSYASRGGLQWNTPEPMTPGKPPPPLPERPAPESVGLKVVSRNLFSRGLLDPDHFHVYDRFILIYSDYMFTCGLLEQRIHVLKFLNLWKLGFAPGGTSKLILETPCACGRLRDTKPTRGGGPFPTTAHSRCACGRPARTRVVCAVCELPCTSVVTACMRCGHGGHIDHMRQWFADAVEEAGGRLEEVQCPAACGCRCMAVVGEEGEGVGLEGETGVAGR